MYLLYVALVVGLSYLKVSFIHSFISVIDVSCMLQEWLARRKERKAEKQTSVFFNKDEEEVTVEDTDSAPSSPEMVRNNASVTKDSESRGRS